ncbi:MAG: hypothetical protein IKJ88_08990 [Clostridia bacterium]|nr:hypothetical protein [Clostridia bacterium]MBR3975982.1 hypothetical protein [Clostridia bacterium]
MADNKQKVASQTDKASLDKIYSLLVIAERKIRLLENELYTIKQLLRKGG